MARMAGSRVSRSASFTLRGIDWQLWIERNGRVTTAKCPLRLEIESRLRSWLRG